MIRNFLFILLLGAFLTSCIEENGRTGVRPVNYVDDTPETNNLCSDFYNLEDGICHAESCPSGTHVLSEEPEKTIILNSFINDTIPKLTEQEQEEANFALESAKGLCAPGSGVLRPTKALSVRSDFCSCLKGQPDIIGNCTAFCAGKNDQKATLYGTVDLDIEIAGNVELGNLYNWCNQSLSASDLGSPQCRIEAKDVNGNLKTLSIILTPGSNSFSSPDMDVLEIDKTYNAKIVEFQSGSAAESKSFQLIRKSTLTEISKGPLKVAPISGYSCIRRKSDGEGNVSNPVTSHFYFLPSEEPFPMDPYNPKATDQVFCHDIDKFGLDDDPTYPRLQLTAGVFSLWDKSDSRMIDSDGDDSADINETIRLMLSQRGVNITALKVFDFLEVSNRPNTTGTMLGFYLAPFVDDDTNRAYCPTNEHYNGTSKLLNVLGEVIGTDTEGLFLAKKQPEAFTNPATGEVSTAPTDVIFIRESELDQVRFYVQNGQKIRADDITASQKTVYFYYPIDTDTPLTQKDYQRLYTVIDSSSLGSSDSSVKIPRSIRPSDKRFGCVPKI